MTATVLKQLLEGLPPEELAKLGENYHLGGGDSPENISVAKFVILYKDLAIGWKLARKYAQLGKPFPALTGADNWLWRAYLTECNPHRYTDDTVFAAKALTKAGMSVKRASVEAFLVTQDADIEQVSLETGMSGDVIEAYEKLFFNVLDRMEDHLYIQEIVYPDSRLVEMYEDYVQNASLTDMLRRIGFNGNMQDIRHFCGTQPSSLASMATSEMSSMFEATVMTNGYVLAKNGFLNQRTHAQGIHVAKGILAAAKAGGEESPIQSDLPDIGRSLMAEMSRLKTNESTARLSLIQEHKTGNKVKVANVKSIN